MDYEKKYKDAIKIAKELFNSPRTCFDIEQLTEIFPELRESEDEGIRKQIIDYLLNELHNVKQLTPRTNEVEAWIAYLEKQKNNGFAPRVLPCSAAWFEDDEEKQKEQKPSAEEVLIKAGLKPYKDGNQWCILIGDNIQEGVCGFGDTIEDALYELLKAIQEQQPAEWMAGQFQKIEGELVDWYSTSDGKDYCCGVKTQDAFEVPEGFYIKKR